MIASQPSRQGIHSMETWDGVKLVYRSWLPVKSADKALILFHRGHEHSGRWQGVVDSLRLDDWAIFAWDARGHGLSPGPPGSAPNLGSVVKDVDTFVRYLAEGYGIELENIVCLGHSLGAVTLAAWVHDYAPRIRAMVLATAAFKVRLYVPLAIPLLRLKQRVAAASYVKSYVSAKMLTHDPAEAAAYNSDPLVSGQIAVNILLDLNDTSKRLLADAGAIHLPTLMLGAGSDWVVDLRAQRRFFDGLSSSVKRMEVLPKCRHAIFHDDHREQVIGLVRNFIRERFTVATPEPQSKEADGQGHTWKEYERLKLNGKPHYAVIRGGLKTAGKLSRGIEVGWRNGFDSGLSLDYIYQNQPHGVTGIGRLIDRIYLNSPGWKGIRQRKANLDSCLRKVIDRTAGEGKEVHILDIAVGGGSYIREAIQSRPRLAIRATLFDNEAENVDVVKAWSSRLEPNRVDVARADGFDPELLRAIRPRPTIAVVSGLYELFPDNAPIQRSLTALAETIEGGYLIYTNQPWHPQLEFIARVLRNRNHQPWIMRRRTTGEMDQLVEAAGFEKLEMEIDQWGMFTVSIARRSIR